MFIYILWIWLLCPFPWNIHSQVSSAFVNVFVMRLWVWHRICDETVGVTQDLWWDCGCDTGFVMWLWVWHRICDESVGVTQDFDETEGVTQDLWWDCVCDTGFVMRLRVGHRIQVQLKVSVNVSCFPQYVVWQWTVRRQIVHWLNVIFCASLGPGLA